MPEVRRRIPITLLFTGATLVPLLIVGVFLLYLAVRTTRQVSDSLGEQIMSQATHGVETSIRDYLSHAQHTSDIFAELIESHILPESNFETWHATMMTHLCATPEVAAIGFANARDDYVYLMRFKPELEFGYGEGGRDGTTMHAWTDFLDGRPGTVARPDSVFQIRQRPWYSIAVTTAGPTWTPAYTWFAKETRPAGPEYSVAYTRTIRDPATGRFVGVLSVDTLLTQVNTTLHDLAAPLESVLVITDAGGGLVGCSDVAAADQPAFPPGARMQDIPNPVAKALAKEIIKKGTSPFRTAKPNHITVDGQLYWASQTKLTLGPGTPWYVTIAIPERSILSPVQRGVQWMLTVGAAYITFACIVSILLARQLTRPMKRLAVFAREIGEGRFDRRVEIGTTDEMSRLSRALNAMAVSLRERVTLLSQRDAARQTTAAKNRLIAHVSHEFRTPLNAIMGYAEILREEAAAAARSRDIADASNILTASHHLLRLVDNLLDLSAIEAGGLRLDVIDFSVKALLEAAAINSRPAVERHGNRLVVVPPEQDIRLTSDPGRLTQVLINLLANAGKFTDGGTVTLSAQCEPPAPDGSPRVRLEVTDTGAGIRPDQLSRLFEPFSDVEPANTSVAGRAGAGLGLAISRQLVRMLQGDIEIRSTPGEGTRVTVTLPVQMCMRPAQNPLIASSGDPAAPESHHE